MNRRAAAAIFALGISAAHLAPRVAYAQRPAPTESARVEARERFDRGLRLFNAGDNAGALVEFRRAYELVENVAVLYNIGLVYAQMGRAVEAADSLDRVLATPGTLSPERLALARRTRDEQGARIAEVSIEANVEGGRIEVDGIEAGQTAAGVRLRVTSGTHVLGVIAPGFLPQRKEIAIAGGEKQSLRFELVAMQGRLGHLYVKTHLPGADLFVDDQRVGSTPIAASVSLPPGSHRVELRRAGYATAGADVALGDGAMGEVTLDPIEDPAALGAGAGLLSLDVSEASPVVTVDGRPRGVYTAPLRLVSGPHHLFVERGNFLPAERDVSIDPGRTAIVHVELEPTPDYRAAFSSRARSQRTWGLVSIIGGAVLAAGGAGLVAYDAKQRSDGNATRQGLLALSVRGSGQACDPGQEASAFQRTCGDPLNAANSKVADANTRDYVGWTAVGVGAASVVLGVVLLVADEDPHKYDASKPPNANAKAPTSVPVFWTVPGGGGVGVIGVF